MKKILSGVIMAGLLLIGTGCSSFQNKVEKMGKGMSASDYVVVMYSGGKVVNWWHIKNKFINKEENSDGWFWIDNDRMVRVSGDVVIEEVKGVSLDEVKQKYSLK
jgi:hypothetical protein